MTATIWGEVVAVDRLCLIANKINDIEYQPRINERQQRTTDESGRNREQTTRSEREETNQQHTSANTEITTQKFLSINLTINVDRIRRDISCIGLILAKSPGPLEIASRPWCDRP